MGACMCECVLTCARCLGVFGPALVRAGAHSSPGGAPALSHGCLSPRGGGVLVACGGVGGREGALLASSVFVSSSAAAELVRPRRGRAGKLWDVAEESWSRDAPPGRSSTPSQPSCLI